MKEKLTLVLVLFGFCARAQSANMYDIVINEIMADPSPQVGLPNNEFIELRNVSNTAFNLNGWRVGDASGSTSITTSFILQPDSVVIICSNTNISAFSIFGPSIGVSNFPSLDNAGDQLYIKSKEGRTIHAVAYSDTWYQNPVKSQGGWTLEMIDTKNPCSGFSNWTASNDPKGGTPGKKNSVDAVNSDQQPPMLLNAYAEASTVTLHFDEPIDSGRASVTANYLLSDGLSTPVSATAQSPFFNTVQLQLSTSLLKNKVYTITVNNLSDCAGNTIGAYNKAKFGLAFPADSADIVINEILFNPKPDGVDYVELYNRSTTIVNLKDCYIANRSSGIINALKQISTDNRLLFPGDYLVITEDATAVQKQYLAKDPAAFVVIGSMPSLPNDKGDIVLLNAQGKIIDELQYDEHWQFKLLDNDEGVALERINYNKPTQDPLNWHSAATDAGYGTPGYQNSQFKIDMQVAGDIIMQPTAFSPDNDGFNDFLTITYHFPEPGYTCNITVFDASGRPVRLLTRNALCGIQGYFRWDGLDEKSMKLPVGVYVVHTAIFNLAGKTRRFKQAVILARKI